MPLLARLLTLRNSPLLLQLPPFASALCIVVGIAWLFILPLDEYSRQTYVSENAILPGQVHTYFGGSEHNVFRAYRQEVYGISGWDERDRLNAVESVIRDIGLKPARQDYRYTVAGEDIEGTNLYTILQGPRADATEAMVLIAAWRNFDGQVNFSGVALVLTLARYFKRWSIWSKDIIVLIPSDSTYGPEAWVSAYHSTATEVTSSRNVSELPIKAGALQAAVAIDYPVGPWGHRFDKLDILYDGINGALPNLDLLNTAVSIANGQMGIGCSLHGITAHSDKYPDRLKILTKGVITQSAGHATGPHSAFMPYHVDAITLKTLGDGWHDEMSLGRTTESIFRSINNLLEHLHQSFFFYILLGAQRFVSIGNYLPAAMLIAGNFTVTALALWVQSGRAPIASSPKSGSTNKQLQEGQLEVVKTAGAIVLIPKQATRTVQRQLFVPVLAVLAVHLLGILPIQALNTLNRAYLSLGLRIIAAISYILPAFIAIILVRGVKVSRQQIQIMQSFSLLLLGAALSTLATLNFSLAFVVGVLAAPLSFVRPLSIGRRSSNGSDVAIAMGSMGRYGQYLVEILGALTWTAVSPPTVLYAMTWYFDKDMQWMLLEMAKGWHAQGVYTPLVIWSIWWPAWILGGIVLVAGAAERVE
ncbi:Glycosyl phosphatidyl inositol protein transamidase complex subunit [Recurvomyces mirabilis]|uniref:Glycosyl phosphatidyl inositol protein transamidase complex subunit n=1 Tax=Recurvomyces mirabilis TaxID=574656 RepID=A0AAE1C3Y2_9PEZI|nr:Glycosyl phosphatidyl inositol protein transamidase complex subunit [Recurvomyces mirabilis]KAK5159502.1 Glycosyl phosphatidyl inositol protein transamidase complex subunit [Recurvomyces mirabilis]